MSDTAAVLVTGSSRMIGTALVERLLAKGIDVHGVDRFPDRWSDSVDAVTDQIDLLEPDAQDRIPTGADTVVHLAAHFRLRDMIEEPTGATENLQTLSTALEDACRNDVCLLLTSSQEMYGDQCQTVMWNPTTGVRDAENLYGASKASC